MGLKHGEHPFAASRPRSFQCSANFGRMMRVIVNEQKALAFIFDLETGVARARIYEEKLQFFSNGIPSSTGERNHSEGIVDIVRPWHVQHGLAEFLPRK